MNIRIKKVKFYSEGYVYTEKTIYPNKSFFKSKTIFFTQSKNRGVRSTIKDE